MQDSFLEYVLSDLQQKGVSIKDCTFILPSKRSGTFLKKYIAALLGKNIFSPEILSIEDFVTQISGLSPLPNIDLLLLLYKVYKQSDLKDHDDFNTFIKWGQTLLQDFNEIDRYLIPPKDILNYMSAIKEINHWSLKKEKTELVQNYLELWGHLFPLYHAFSASLLEQKKGYQGLIYREAAKNLVAQDPALKNTPLVFVGFNALNKAEVSIIQHYLEYPKNLIYWDIDAYFLEDPVHDAGLFIRRYRHNWPYYRERTLDGLHRSFLSPKNISIVGAPKNISQTKYVGKLLEQIGSESPEKLKNTAVVLADESLLNPMLQAIPASIAQVNITMGLPLNKTVLYSFFLSFLELHLARTERGWFFENVLGVFSNPYCKVLFSEEKKDIIAAISQDIKEHNRLYLNNTHIRPYTDQCNLLEVIFPADFNSSSSWLNSSLILIQKLKNLFQQDKKAMELEYLYRFHTLFNQLEQQLNSVDFLTDLKSVRSFFKQLASIESLDFIGEPLSGLQIMGMLESRNLDFETVIITSVNEGILPSGKSNNSFFPFDVKREYDLPTYKEKDAIYTYHFYRLIQRAKNIHVIYNTEPDVLEGGERSRLISQLLTDENLSEYITHTVAAPEAKIAPSAPHQILKSQQLQADIKALAGRGFSPTSLTNYIRNPIDFYKKSILKINDIIEVEETIAANTFGTLIHDSLEKLYKPLIGQMVTVEAIASLSDTIPRIVKANFNQLLPGIDTSKGRYLLVFNVIIKYIKKFLALELEQIKKHEVKILALEEKYEINLSIPELDFPVKLKGTLDRVDQVDGITRIVDYKTGRVEPGNVKINNWEDLITNYDKSKAFQLLCYAHLYSQKNSNEILYAGIYSFKNLGRGFLSFSFQNNSITPETINAFKNQLYKLIVEICNPGIPFIEKET